MHRMDWEHQQFAKRYFTEVVNDSDQPFTEYQVIERTRCWQERTSWFVEIGSSAMRKRMEAMGRTLQMELEGTRASKMGRIFVERSI